MAILYYDEKKLFQLNTENTTYVIGLSPEGYVGHVYYGPLLHGEPDLYPLRMDEPPGSISFCISFSIPAASKSISFAV